MIDSDKFNLFCQEHYDEANNYADITIGSLVKQSGALNPQYDIEMVKQLGIIEALEKTFLNFDDQRAGHASHSGKLSNYLYTLVHNCVISELKKEKTRVDRFNGIKRRKSESNTEQSVVTPGAKRDKMDGVIFEPHEIMDIFGSRKGKEKQISEMMKKFKQLPPMDQVVLTFWMNEDQTNREYYLRGEEPQRTYVQRILDYYGLDKSAANAVTLRCFKAKRKLAELLNDVPSDYENLYVPGSSGWKSYCSNSNRSVKIYSDSRYDELEKAFAKLME